MRLRWWLGAVAVGVCFWVRPVQAATWLYQPSSNSDGLSTRLGGAAAGLPGVRLLDSPAEMASLTLSERARVQPNYRYRALWTPNDPDFALQWNFAAMNVPTAWDADQAEPTHGGDPKIVVAVLDTGVAYENWQSFKQLPDFNQTSFWTNPNEIAEDGLDNDQDGLVDDIHGWNFVANTGHANDDNGHGSHIAGIIAASTDNAAAASGIAFRTTIMPLKVLDADGNGTTATIAAAIQYAAAHGANVINLSLGGDSDDPLLHEAIKAAVAQGVIVVGAAGNAGAGTVSYPARYPEVVSVGATQYDGTRAPYANYGADLELVAPGGNLTVDQNDDGQPDGIPSQTCTDHACTTFETYYYVGTSQAAAHVTATAALLEACGAPSGTIRSTLDTTATDLGAAGRDDQFGYGLVNAAAALSAAGCQSQAPSPPEAITATASAKEKTPIWPNQPSPFIHPQFSWSGPAGVIYRVNWSKGSRVLQSRQQTAATFTPTLAGEGVYTLKVNVIDALERESSIVSFDYRYRAPVLVIGSGRTVRLLSAALKTLRTLTPSLKPATPLVQASGGPWSTDYSNRLMVSATAGGPTLSILDTKGRTLKTLTPFGKKFTGQMTATVLNNQAHQPLLVVATATGGAALAWYTADGQAVGRDLLYKSYRSGLGLSAADLDADGSEELIVSQIRGSEVRVYNQERRRVSVVTPLGKKYVGGWLAAAADSNHDGKPELLLLPRTGRSRLLHVVTAQGVVRSRWAVTGWSEDADLTMQAVDLDGNGVSEILVAPRSGPTVIQRWSLAGKKMKQTSLSLRDINSISHL